MHDIYTVYYIKIRPIRKIEENGPFLPDVFLIGVFFLRLPKDSYDVLHTMINFFAM